jgi:hypothetical protein
MGAEEDIWAKRDEVTAEWRRLHKRSFVLCIPHQIFDQIK